MITSEETRRSLRGAMQLARGDATGIDKFNATLEGFWNSITAALIVLPGHALIAWLSYLALPAEATTGRILLVEGLGYVIEWTAFQLALFYFAHGIGRGDRFFSAAVSLNWAGVPMIVLAVGILVLIRIGLMPIGLGWFLSLSLQLGYMGYVSKVALRSSALAACGPPAFAFVMSLVMQRITMAMTGQG